MRNRVWPPAEWCSAINPERTHICDQPVGHEGDHQGVEMPTVTVDETWCCCDVMPARECPVHGEWADQ